MSQESGSKTRSIDQFTAAEFMFAYFCTAQYQTLLIMKEIFIQLVESESHVLVCSLMRVRLDFISSIPEFTTLFNLISQ